MKAACLSPADPLIIYDLVFATRRPHLTGIERYAINMFSASARRQSGVVALVADPARVPPSLPTIKVGGFPKDWLALRWHLAKGQARRAVMICAAAPASPSLLFSNIPIARIIHDDFAWSRASTLSRGGRLFFRDYENLMLRRDDLIFAPTEIARGELAATLGRGDIGLAGNAPGLDPDGPRQMPVGLKDIADFTLMVGTVEPRKNYERAARIAAQGLSGRHIVVAGRRGWQGSAEVLEAAVASGHLTWFKDTSDDELRWLYAHCRQFLALSHAEGFNMPLVEAGIANCPIICSDLPIHRAVAAPWAQFIPGDADDQRLAQMLDAAPFAAVASADYRARFSWERVAEAVERPLKALWHERAR